MNTHCKKLKNGPKVLTPPLLLYAKMLKDTETEKHRLFCLIFIIGVISIGGEGAGPLGRSLCLIAGPVALRHTVNQTRRHGGAYRGRAPLNDCLFPLNENCALPSDDCAPKKITGSGLLECKSRPKMVFSSIIFVLIVD